MIWLTWRQHRKQALFTAIGLAVLAALMIPTGLAMRNTYADKGLDDCLRSSTESCRQALNHFYDQYDLWMLVGVLFLVLPLLVGLFWGAPLVAREVEQGTHRLIWTQGISRRRWALVKFGLVGAATVAVAAAYGLGMSWWLEPMNKAGEQSRFDYLFFDMQGVVPIAYTLFAVALGIFTGTVWPRVVPAMGAAFAGFAGLRIAVEVLARPRYQPAETRTYPVQNTPLDAGAERGDWVLAKGIRNAEGDLVASGVEIGCPPGATGPGGRTCGADFGIGPGAYNWHLYQPADRFWLFQGIEAGVFIALAALLLYLALRRVRRIG